MSNSSILNVVPFCKGTEQCSTEKLVKKSCIWTSCNIHQGSIYSQDFCFLNFRSRCREGIKHGCLSFEHVCLCTRGTPGSRELAKKKSSHGAQKSRQETEVQPWQPSVCGCALCSPAASEQMQEAVRATYQTDHTGSGNSAPGTAMVTHGY